MIRRAANFRSRAGVTTRWRLGLVYGGFSWSQIVTGIVGRHRVLRWVGVASWFAASSDSPYLWSLVKLQPGGRLRSGHAAGS